MTDRLIDRKEPPVCAHGLGQQLVTQLWKEAQELKAEMVSLKCKAHRDDKLYAIVDDGNMDGDSAYYCPDSRVEYVEGMSLEDIRKSYFNSILDDFGEEDALECANNIKVAWIVTDKQIKQINNTAPECFNDSQTYTVNRTLKHMVQNMCLKEIK